MSLHLETIKKKECPPFFVTLCRHSVDLFLQEKKRQFVHVCILFSEVTFSYTFYKMSQFPDWDLPKTLSGFVIIVLYLLSSSLACISSLQSGPLSLSLSLPARLIRSFPDVLGFVTSWDHGLIFLLVLWLQLCYRTSLWLNLTYKTKFSME